MALTQIFILKLQNGFCFGHLLRLYYCMAYESSKQQFNNVLILIEFELLLLERCGLNYTVGMVCMTNMLSKYIICVDILPE